VKPVKVEKVDENFLREVVKRIVDAVSPSKIILFGSHAYGKPCKGSDLDILVIVDKVENSRRETRLEVREALGEFLLGKDIIVATTQDVEEWKDVSQAFITYITKRGGVLYEKESGIEFEKIHDLEELIGLASEVDNSLLELRENVKRLTDYAVDVRYPALMEEPTEEEAVSAIEIAMKLKEFVLERLQGEVGKRESYG
jgi:predicted nucleotidyltransferase